MQVADFNSTKTISTNNRYNAGVMNNGSSEVKTFGYDGGGTDPYIGDPGVAAFRVFSVDGTTGGSSRPIQVGDQFSITAYVVSTVPFFANSNVGISINSGTASSQYSDFNSGQRLKMQINQGEDWFVAGQLPSAGYCSQGQDVTFTFTLTSSQTANVSISGFNGATTSDLELSGSGAIESLCIWNRTSGNSNDVYWKNCSVTSTGTVTLGEHVQTNSITTISGVISDGLAANSTTTASVNNVIKNGSGTITLTGANTYTGTTSINSGKLIIAGSGTLGIGSAVTVASGAELQIENEVSVASINNSGTIVVKPGGKLVVSGDVTNNGQFTIEADATGYGQLKFDGGLPGSNNVVHQQYLNGTGHHAISSSMMDGFTTASGTTNALYGYDASTGAYSGAVSQTDPGLGYFAPVGTNGFLTTSGVFSLSGTPVTSHTHNLGFGANQQAGGSGSGWNLIGNPYTCALDWSTVTKPSALNDAIYIWDPSSSTYKYWVDGTSQPTSWSGTYAGSQLSGSLIAPMQAFWVQTTATTSFSTTMSANGSVSTTTYYKNNPDNLVLMAMEFGDSTKADAMWLKNVAGTTQGFEGGEDAWKMGNYGGQPMLYSVHADEELAINAVDLSMPSVVPVGFKAPQQGLKYQIDLEQVVNSGLYTVYLEDKHLGTFNDLSMQPYTFVHEGWNSESPRFALHVSASTLGLDESAEPQLWAYQDGSRVVVTAPESGRYELLSLDGRVLKTGELATGLNILEIHSSLSSGMYVVRLDSKTPRSTKLVLNLN
jgi:autotransporter-associated beta strand protein